jgi:hypothetical protein
MTARTVWPAAKSRQPQIREERESTTRARTPLLKGTVSWGKYLFINLSPSLL